MAGHSHSANIKHRKDRQDSARSQLFLRLRKKLEAIIKEEGGINDKSLVIARENQFPKAKLLDIWEKVKSDKDNNPGISRYLALGKFGIILYVENVNSEIIKEIEKELSLKQLNVSSLNSYFTPRYYLGLDDVANVEELLLELLPEELIQKVDYDADKKQLVVACKEENDKIKNILTTYSDGLIKEERTCWDPLFYLNEVDQDFSDYYLSIKEKMISLKLVFYDNVVHGTVA